MKYFRSHKGFTLVEMVLYVSLCSIFLLTLSTLLTFLLETRVRSQAIAEVNQQGFQVMNMITQTVRNGRSVEVPSIGTSSTTLSVTTPVPVQSPTVFDVSSGTVRIKEGSGNPVALTNSRVNVTELQFQNVSSIASTEKSIKVLFTIQHINLGGRSEYTFTKSFTGSATLR